MEGDRTEVAIPTRSGEPLRDIASSLRQLREALAHAMPRDRFYGMILRLAVPLLRAKGAACWSGPPRQLRSSTNDAVGSWTMLCAEDEQGFFASWTNDQRVMEGHRIAQNVRTHTSCEELRLPEDLNLSFSITSPRIHSATSDLLLVFYLSHVLPIDAQLGCQRYLDELAQIAADYERIQSESPPTAGTLDWQSFDQFVSAIQYAHSASEVAYVVANEARRLLHCERAFVLLRRSGRFQVEACSGVDVVDRHSKLTKSLEELVAVVAPLGQPWGTTGEATALEPQIQGPLELYLDQTTLRALAIIPLVSATRDRNVAAGVLVLENLQHQPLEYTTPLSQAVARHSAEAIANTFVTRASLVRLAAWLIRPWSRWSRDRRLPRWVWVSGLLLGVLAAIMLVPVQLRIRVDGELTPRQRQRVFASHDGFLDEVSVVHGDVVKQGDPVARIVSPELDLELRRLLGELQTIQEQLASTTAERFQVTGVDALSIQRANQLTATELSLQEQKASLEAQLQIVRQQESQLVLTSPMSGTILDWNVQQRLQGRPVQRGQAIVQVADLGGPWILELRVPDRKAGHVLAASASTTAPHPISFVVNQQPDVTHQGFLSERGLVTQDSPSGQPHVLMVATFAQDAIISPRPGATVVAKIECGKRRLGFVLFHDVAEELRRAFF